MDTRGAVKYILPNEQNKRDTEIPNDDDVLNKEDRGA